MFLPSFTVRIQFNMYITIKRLSNKNRTTALGSSDNKSNLLSSYKQDKHERVFIISQGEIND